MQISLSICLIIKNEGKNLSRCLSGIKDIASEIIIVDTGSTDNSLLIASQFTDNVYSYKWRNDFSSARNYGLEKAEGEWILVLDGDEVLDEKSCGYLLDRIKTADIDAYLININNYSKKSHEMLDTPDLQLRLFRNRKTYSYRGIIHEQILDSILECNPSGKIEVAPEINITHYGYAEDDTENQNRLMRNLNLINKALEQEEETLRHLFLGREYYRHHKFAEALEHLQFVFERSGPDASYIPELLRSISISLYMIDRAEDALSFADKALKILPDAGDLYYIKAIIYKNNSQYDMAYQEFKKCLNITCQSNDYSSAYCRHKYKIYYYMGGLAEYFMNKDHALVYFFESLKQNPYILDSLRRIIMILNPRVNSEYTIDSLNRVFDLSERGLQAEMAVMFYEEGAFQLAFNSIEQLENSGIISENLRLVKGLSLLRNQQYLEAEKELQFISHNKNLYIEARQYLTLYYWVIKDYRKAAGCIKRIKNAGARASVIYVLNLLIRGYSGKTNTIQDQSYRMAKLLVELVVELGDVKQVDEAFYNFAPVLGSRPSRLLAEIFFQKEKYELAEKELHDLLETGNTDAQAFYYLGKTYWARGNLNSAEKYLYQAIDNGLDTPKIRWEMARLYQELAIASLKEGLRDYPYSAEMKQLEDLENGLLEI